VGSEVREGELSRVRSVLPFKPAKLQVQKNRLGKGGFFMRALGYESLACVLWFHWRQPTGEILGQPQNSVNHGNIRHYL
jgi:hypothetical protein